VGGARHLSNDWSNSKVERKRIFHNVSDILRFKEEIALTRNWCKRQLIVKITSTGIKSALKLMRYDRKQKNEANDIIDCRVNQFYQSKEKINQFHESEITEYSSSDEYGEMK
jgi:hypothetical protein